MDELNVETLIKKSSKAVEIAKICSHRIFK